MRAAENLGRFTLDDPTAAQTQIGSGLRLIAESRRRANEVKRRANVTVVIGNPPYRERAEGMGGWVERGSDAHGRNPRGILEDWRDPDTARYFHNLKNLYVYFWRWASWKVWESTPNDADDGDAGVICFISTSGYVGGPGFTAMREYLRREASEGWVIDLTPEGQTPDVPTRIFPGVRQPLAIGLFIRKPEAAGDVPATIHYRAVHGRQAEKFAQLSRISLDDDGWRQARTSWAAPLTPAADTAWDDYPALNDLLPWTSPGVTGNRRWPYGPSPRVLERRWRTLQAEPDPGRRAALLKETSDRSLASMPLPLPMTSDGPLESLAQDRGEPMAPVRVGYRSLDRQWLIPDARILDRARPDLWAARLPGQVFAIEQHSKAIADGPGLVFSALIPDMDHFKGSEGGRALPLVHPNGSPNLAPGLLRALSARYGREVTARDVLAYVASIVAHPHFTRTFADELTTPGIRVPLTVDADLFTVAATLGEQVIWLYTYGETYAAGDRPLGDIRYPQGDERQPKARTPITTMPTEVTYDSSRAVVILGGGEFGPVRPKVWAYAVGGKNVIRSWVNYRKAEPGGKKTSPLDHIHVDEWDPDWTTEFIDLLTVLTRLVELEPAQSELLRRVLADPVLTMEQLRTVGVQWPTGPRDRRPQFGMAGNEDRAAPELDLGV